MTSIDTTALRGEPLYNRVLEELATDETLPADRKFWDQGLWRGLATPYTWNDPSRGRCGTTMCLAGTTCDLTGGKWLVHVTPEGPTVAGQLVDPDETGLFLTHLDFLLAEDDDDPAKVQKRFGHDVIRADDRAARLLGFRTAAEEVVFYMPDDLARLRRHGEWVYGSRTA